MAELLSLRSFAQLIADENKLENVNISIMRDIKSGNGFMGEIFKIKLEANSNMSIVVKVSVRNERVRAIVPVDEAYNNELTFYKDIFPAMKNLQKELGMEKTFDSVPHFLKAAEYGDQCYLAMEDLIESGFIMADLKKDIDDDHLIMVCTLFGRFHALSFAFKHFKPESYRYFVGKLKCVHTGFLRYKGGLLKQCVTIIRDALDTTKSSYRMLNHYVENIEKTYKDILFRSREDQYSCLIHYDGWFNNLMFKYLVSEEKKTLVDVKLFDWQTCNVGSPAIDLSIVLYSVASENILKNLSYYLKIYHNAFGKFLSQMSLKIEDIYPFEVLEQQWRKYGQYGFIRGLLVHKIKMNLQNEIENFEDAINAEFDVEGMQFLIDNLFEHMQLGVFRKKF